jgi:polyhydroxybutyrate depolymerase
MALALAALSVLGSVACEMAPVAPGCSRLAPGDFTCSVGTRTYLLHVPASYTGQTPVPLVIDMHGFTSTAGAQRNISGWLAKSNREGFVAAWPQGIGNSWNSQGQCCGTANGTTTSPPVNDVDFLKSVAAQIQLAGSIDPGRIFATGLSNGGAMSQTLACEAADVFAAVAPVSFQLSGGGGAGVAAAIIAECTPARPVTVVHFHGLNDTTVPYNTGVLDSLGSQESLSVWAQIQRCDAANVDTRASSNTLCETNSNCTGGATVTLCSVTSGTHVLYPNVVSSGTNIPDIAYPFFLRAAR